MSTKPPKSPKALNLSAELVRSAALHSPIGMALVSAEGNWLFVNPALCAFVGYTEQELLASTWQSLTHPDDLVNELPFLARLLAGKAEGGEYEKRLLHKNGQIVWLQLNVSVVRTGSGDVSHIICQYQNITARRRTENTLKSTTEQLQLALKASGMGVLQLNMETRALAWDARVCEIFGVHPPTSGTNMDGMMAFVIPEDRHLLEAARELLMTQGIGYDLQLRIRRLDGAIRNVSTQVMVNRTEVDVPVAAVGVISDLTDLVQATEETGRLREKLRQARKMETIGMLAAGIAHDFNNLLNVINGFVDLGESKLPPDHEATKLLGKARDGAQQATVLVRRILDFARLVPEAKRSVVELPNFVHATLPLLSAGLTSRIKLTLEIEDEVPLVKADGNQIQQVLMNLCVNGAHAIGKRSGSIRICLGNRVIDETGSQTGTGKVRPGR